ncbi:MAG: cytidylate kinase-like family protein [Clostridia bacterium]|jgi:cytidylate kinase|nr:cytidylate kinase-like family protein [Clostridia bacterium]
MNKIITISRQFGSGGRTIGKLTAERLGIPCYDREIIEEVAKSSGFAKEYVEAHGEYADHRTWLGSAIKSANRFGGMTNQDKIWIEQRKLILEIAKSPCVIVGRCADYILKERDDVLNVFIHADTKFRAERIVKLYGEKADKPEKRLKDKDKRRAAYYKDYTETEWGVASNYHISLDSGKLGVENCVDLLEKIFSR